MKFGIPYMGSKSDIIASLALCMPKAKHFYDLFGGGGAVSHYMAAKNRYPHVHYNELEETTVTLFRDAIAGKYNYNVFKPKWISREEFFERKDTDAYVRLIWSFGNNQRTYLFGEDIEQYKKSLHQAVVFDEFDATAIKVLGFNRWPDSVNTITLRRLYLAQKTRFEKKGRHELQQLERLQQLQQLERLQQLQQLQQLERLTTSALDYRNVPLEKDCVVYCDIPYSNTGIGGRSPRDEHGKIIRGTHGYQLKFNHQEFYDWAHACPYPVFFSEYTCSDSRFKCVYSVERKTKLSQKGMTAHHDEKLFWNGKYGEKLKVWNTQGD